MAVKYQMAVHKIGETDIKFTPIFHCKTLQNLPKFGFLVYHLANLTGA
jgi:hypothetical protein